jgi:hypothetical protein
MVVPLNWSRVVVEHLLNTVDASYLMTERLFVVLNWSPVVVETLNTVNASYLKFTIYMFAVVESLNTENISYLKFTIMLAERLFVPLNWSQC